MLRHSLLFGLFLASLVLTVGNLPCPGQEPKKGTADQEKLQKFWMDYYDAMKRYYDSLPPGWDKAAPAPPCNT